MSVPTYAYAMNNPLMYVDPSGLFVEFGADVNRYQALEAQLTMHDILVSGGAASRGLKQLLKDKKSGVFLRPMDERFTTGEGGVTSPVYTDSKGRRACEVQFSNDGHYKALSGKGINPRYYHTDTSLLGHEFGHASGKLYGGDDSQRAIDWENELLPPGHWQRPDHYTPYPAGP